MSRRILTATFVVAVLVVVGFGVPLAVAVQRLYRNEAIVRLEGEAARAGGQVPATFRTSGDPVEIPLLDDGTRLGVYAPDGTRLLGAGPERGGAEVAQAATGRVAESTGGTLVVASPLTSDEQVFAVMRAELPRAAVTDRVHRAWLLMAALAALLLLAAGVIGRVLSDRIARPVADLASASARLGRGDFTARAGPSGIAELDAAAGNLNATAERLGRVMERERAFSADASHQLRTPITGLRLHLETALAHPTVDPGAAITVALGEVDRLERTIDDLLALARDVDTRRGAFDLHVVIDRLQRNWHWRLAAGGRPLRVDIDASTETAHASPGAVSQILDVLISNAVEHGRGTVCVQAYSVSGGVAIDVSDEGSGIVGNADDIFQRRSGDVEGRGIGLALARSLAEAEDARLVLTNTGQNPVFRLILRDSD